eukprot:TRINITY_DN52155_c0_g1_i4.p2 TRINITY_DN52155_c0_g1~~TRINITY_DN52155_c0_g1_i4.p2  ORF type:complete len:313 (-),score=26.66 TRINITY_DN52155_c0_g1_i4:173-1057(-)
MSTVFLNVTTSYNNIKIFRIQNIKNKSQTQFKSNAYKNIIQQDFQQTRKQRFITNCTLSRDDQLDKNIQNLLLQSKSFDEEIDILSRHAIQLQELKRQRILIGIAGVPGGGKSTVSQKLQERINEVENSETAIVLPMDGFHYTKAYLSQMQDPEGAFFRRGAHWTFDADAFVNCVRKVKEQSEVLAPSFQHGVGDPVQDDIHINDNHLIVFVEGNYVLLDIEPWQQLKEIFDESWFVDCSLDDAMDRVFSRQTGNGLAPEVSKKRVEGNDRPNGELIQRSKHQANFIIPTRPMK